MFFESQSTKPVRVFISDSVKKPGATDCDKVILSNEVPKSYTPGRSSGQLDLVFGHKRSSVDQNGRIMEKQVFLTVRADDGPSQGRIHVRSDVTMAQL